MLEFWQKMSQNWRNFVEMFYQTSWIFTCPWLAMKKVHECTEITTIDMYIIFFFAVFQNLHSTQIGKLSWLKHYILYFPTVYIVHKLYRKLRSHKGVHWLITLCLVDRSLYHEFSSRVKKKEGAILYSSKCIKIAYQAVPYYKYYA